MLGPAAALARLQPSAAHALYRQWAKLQLEQLGIELHVHDESDSNGRDSVLFVDLLERCSPPSSTPARCRGRIEAHHQRRVRGAAVHRLVRVRPGRRGHHSAEPKQATAVLKRVAKPPAEGETFGISIEGKRTEDGALSPYKKGPAALAIDAQCDIVPFLTRGEYALWPRGQWQVRPGHIKHHHPHPCVTRGLTYADRGDVVLGYARWPSASRARVTCSLLDIRAGDLPWPGNLRFRAVSGEGADA